MSKPKLGQTRATAPCLGLLLFWLSGAPPAVPAAQKQVDVRRIETSAAEKTAAQTRSAQILQTAARRFGPGLSSSHDNSGKLRSLARYTPPLSAPDRRDAEVVGRAFARAHRDLLDIDDAWVRNLELVARDKSGPNTLLKFRQQWSGIPVFQSDLRIHVSPAGEVLELEFHLEPLAPPSQPTSGNSYVTPEWALLQCARDLEPELRNPRTEIIELAQAPRQRTKLRFGPLGDEVTAQWVWFPVAEQLRLAWQFDAVSSDSKTYYECVVDAQDGTLLYRNSVTDSDFTGLVFDAPSPQPSATPGVIPPIPNPPVIIPRSSLSFAGDPTASPAGWVGSTLESIGNNVIAREDKAGDNELTLGATAKAINGSFNFDLQLGPGAPSPVNFTEAAITSLFYWCNVAHDYFYNLGFTETAGNFQEDNFGKGGAAADSLRADAQDGANLNSLAYLNNASMSTPTDGSKPRMTVYLWGSLGGPYVDADFDAEVLLHEYTHGVFRRLTGTGGVQSGAINEGNSDFFSLNYLTPAAASPDGAFTAGGYSKQNFARGVRTRPYSTDLSVNDLSYADFGHNSSAGFEVHADGEIWVEAMWEVRSRLIKALGFDEGRRRVAQLMIKAMKRSPYDPSYVDMRDALIAADRADEGGADVDLIWEAFARRGIGFMAVGGTGSTYTVLPSQDLPSPAGKIRFFDDCFFIGEYIKVYVGDSNNLDEFLTLHFETSGGDSEVVYLMRSGALFQATLTSVAGEAVKKNDDRIQVAPGDIIRVTYHDADDGTSQARDVITEAEIRSAYSTQQQPSPADIVGSGETSLGMKGSGLTYAGYTLPFAFPFYKRLVNYIYYNENGLITIDTPTSSGSNSAASLQTYQAIAPLWMDLRENGTSVANEGVYVSRPTSESIRFRWAAETVKRNTAGALIAGNPVNFAVTLFQSGDILFEYGPGNTDITPTIGISRRAEGLSQIYTEYSSSSSAQLRTLDRAQSILWKFPGNQARTTVFPYLRATNVQYTGYAVVNRTEQPVDILFSAQTDDGQNPVPANKANAIYLTAGAQAAVLGSDLFPSLPSVFNGWVEATSTDSRLTGFFVTGDNAQTCLTGVPAAAQLSRDLTFTHIPAGSGTMSATTVYLVNPGFLPANLDICWHDASGTANPICTQRTLAPRNRLAAEVSSLFTALPSDFQSGYLRITSDVGIAGVAHAQTDGAPYMIAAQEPSAATTLYAAQFASGKNGSTRWVTDVNLVNTSDSPRTIALRLLDNNGNLVSLPSPGTNPCTIPLEPGGELHMRGDQIFHLPDPTLGDAYYEGTLVATADGSGIVGDVTFGEGLTHRFTASLPMAPADQSDQIFAQVAEGQAGGGKPYFTGIALFNPNATEITVQIQVFERRGILAARTDLTLGPQTRIVRTLGQLIPGINQVGGYIHVTSSGGPVAAFAVYGDSALDFLVAIPPQNGGW